MAIILKFVLVLSPVVLTLLPLCQPLEVHNYEGTEDWPELAAGRQHQRTKEEDRTGFNMRRLGGAISEPEEPEPIPITEPEEPEPVPITEPEEPEPIPITEPEEPEPKPVPGVNPSPVIIMPIPAPGSTASSAVRSRWLLSSVFLF